MSINISVIGAKELDAALKGLPSVLSESMVTKAHSDAAFPLVSAAHFLAPVGKTGNLADSIGIEKVGIKRGGNIGQISVGPRRKGGFKGFHGHLIEYGKTNRDGSRTQPRPFMEPAFNNTKTQVETGIAREIGKRITMYLKRTVKS